MGDGTVGGELSTVTPCRERLQIVLVWAIIGPHWALISSHWPFPLSNWAWERRSTPPHLPMHGDLIWAASPSNLGVSFRASFSHAA